MIWRKLINFNNGFSEVRELNHNGVYFQVYMTLVRVVLVVLCKMRACQWFAPCYMGEEKVVAYSSELWLEIQDREDNDQDRECENSNVGRTVVGEGVTNEEHATNQRYHRLPASVPAVVIASLDTIAVGHRLRAFWQLAIEFDEGL